VVEELKGLTPEMIDLTGFSQDLILDNDDRDDEVPVDAPAISKLGEIYQLGKHRLMCGDATDPEQVKQLMEGLQADMVFTDPPYNVNYKGAGENTSNHIENDNLSDAGFSEFLDKTFKNYRDNIKEGAGTYVFHSPTTQVQFENSINKGGFEVKYQLIWNKPSALAWGWGTIAGSMNHSSTLE